MTLVRILVDGEGLLRLWKDLDPGLPQHSETAREELIHRLTRYSDATATPVTIVLEGGPHPVDLVMLPAVGPVEVVFSRPGQKVHQLIERLAPKLGGEGNFLVVGDDFSNRQMIQALGGTVSDCGSFIRTVQETFTELERQIARLNLEENEKFTQNG